MSAALSTIPHQPTSVPTLATPPLVPASPSNRRYPSSHSSPTRENHANQYGPSASSPQASSSSRRPSRHPSGHDSQTNSPMSSRAAIASPVPVTTTTTTEHHQGSSSDRRKNMPAQVPPRTSSNQHTSGVPSVSRRAQASDRATNSPRRAQADSGRDATGSVEPDAADEAAGQSSRSRRANQMPQEAPQRSSSVRDGRAGGSSAVMPIRSQQAASAQTSARTPSREASEILNSVLVSQPEVDIDREKERLALAQPHHEGEDYNDDDDAAPPPIVPTGEHEEGRRGGRSRHDHSKKEKHTKFGEYILGNTIGEGEFGKVKLGWKQEGGVQVAIKLIKKDQLGNNPSRMQKIMREVSILQQLTHPNIVRLHKMEESERHYGIVLEYASGGELFDYILNHRYLKDNAARRLFAQLVSGVGYLHKKGIVHRDLKLENLLLDRNRNIIITDFGFANTFDPQEELTEEEEFGLNDRDFVKRMGLDKIKTSGHRKGDLMQTSCGSPCYAAPELVVSDALYTGRKVDVWSCGVILYAMLAGYLPFDDDPANPEGDNINLLYKYIVNTPLSFPEYVTPHARDLLRRILVPNPRKRADLFEVARHSWLNEYAHVVEFITSSTTTPGEIQDTTVPSEDSVETPGLGRSASVREASKKAAVSTTIGGLASKHGAVEADAEAAQAKQQRDNKRRTVQVEYVAPNTTTTRGEMAVGQPSGSKTRARSSSQGPVEVSEAGPSGSQEKPLPKDPPVSKEAYSKAATTARKPSNGQRSSQPPVSRATRDARATSENNAYMASMSTNAAMRPTTGGSMQSTGSRGVGGRASYAQPVPPELADTNVHGRIQQPQKGAKNCGAPGQSPQEQHSTEFGTPSVSVPSKFAQVSGFTENDPAADGKGHKRSSTMGEISSKLFGRRGSMFSTRSRKRPEQAAPAEKSRKYPPVSMNNSLSTSEEPRASLDSRQSRMSFGLGRKRSGSISGSQNSQDVKTNKRFSLIPPSFTKAIGLGKDYGPPAPPESQPDLPIQEPPQVDQYGRYIQPNMDRGQADGTTPMDEVYDDRVDPHRAQALPLQATQQQPQQQYQSGRLAPGNPTMVAYMPGAVLNDASESSLDKMRRPPGSAPHQEGYRQPEGGYDGRRIVSSSRANTSRSLLQKNKRFADAWDNDGSSRAHDHSGSSGPARRVMDFFRRRGRARGGDGN